MCRGARVKWIIVRSTVIKMVIESVDRSCIGEIVAVEAIESVHTTQAVRVKSISIAHSIELLVGDSLASDALLS